MTVIQKCSRGEMVKIIQRRHEEEVGGEWLPDSIYRQIVLLEALGLIEFPNDRRPAKETTPNAPVAFRISRDRIASEEEIAHALFDQMLFVPVTDPADGGQTLRGMIEPEGAQLIVRHLRDMGFEIVKTDNC